MALTGLYNLCLYMCVECSLITSWQHTGCSKYVLFTKWPRSGDVNDWSATTSTWC